MAFRRSSAIKFGNYSNPPITAKDVFITEIYSASSEPRQQLEVHKLKKIAVKDNIATSNGIATTCASKILINYQSPFEAEVLKKLGENGESVIIGKSKMDEFGMGSNSIHSMWGPARRKSLSLRAFSPGGSSGGSAVAVADNYCDLGIGTDTGGSIRLPAAYTGIVGFKPSYGLISRWGIIPYANSLDTVGFLTWTVDENERAFRQTLGYDHRDPTSIKEKDRRRIHRNIVDVRNCSGSRAKAESISSFSTSWLRELTIGFPLEYNTNEIDSEIISVWKLILKLLRKMGANVVPVSLPNTKYSLPAYYVLASAEAASNLAKYDGVRYGTFCKGIQKPEDTLHSETRGKSLGTEVRRRIILGSYTLSSKRMSNYFIQAQKVRRLIQRDFDRVFKIQNPLRDKEQFDMSYLREEIPVSNKLGPETIDYIICPTAATYPPTLENVIQEKPVDTYINDIFTVPASLAGLPTISVPVKLLDNSLFAVGIQVIGQYGEDFGVLRLGNQLEKTVNYVKNKFTCLKMNRKNQRN
ncbi:Glutamyl-tRNA amidotransferase subunit A, mitochondrial [Golovinomyces cichoracearum]|uniref:Glutamyl-tRNA(Gln) amidotransferase subunit A, mitochondrial n=1 Tax=Golovinomyces cichoracearum TaxID=62708 RepID=A0A420J2A0_9PEZI|nr:Glutamyl-tRNA amidotransferase subunit A, mitochondrial [Golovinomyces cichoracearum]